MELDEYQLRRWSLLVRLRDDFTCYICGKRCKKSAQGHHIYAKSVRPDLAYDLSNGITVCSKHHQPLVHIRWASWKKWTDMFKRPNTHVANKKFNEANQHKVRRVRSGNTRKKA